MQLGLSGAAMFGPSGEVLQPSEVLRKRPVLVERGSFRPVTKVNIDMIDSARERFAAEPEVEAGQVVELMEITMRNLMSAGKLDLSDFLARADLLAAAGKTVLISDYFEYYRLAGYLARYTKEPIAVTMGAASLRDLFKEEYYAGLEGGILEAFGKLFTKDLRIYVYPLRDHASGRLETVGGNPDGRRACTVSTATWWRAAGSGNSTTSMKACCTSSRGMCCGASRMATLPGRTWCLPKSPR